LGHAAVKKEGAVRNAEKRRSTAPEKPAEEAPAEETPEPLNRSS
jgi:hypothetical protein